MDSRQRQSLDRYITGNYGEDQFRSEHWPESTAHRDFWEQSNCAHVYEYDPTDDGPEVEAIISVRINHPTFDLVRERADYQFASLLLDKVAEAFKDPATAEAMRMRGVRL